MFISRKTYQEIQEHLEFHHDRDEINNQIITELEKLGNDLVSILADRELKISELKSSISLLMNLNLESVETNAALKEEMSILAEEKAEYVGYVNQRDQVIYKLNEEIDRLNAKMTGK